MFARVGSGLSLHGRVQASPTGGGVFAMVVAKNSQEISVVNEIPSHTEISYE